MFELLASVLAVYAYADVIIKAALLQLPSMSNTWQAIEFHSNTLFTYCCTLILR